jgi:hypothetical protein
MAAGLVLAVTSLGAEGATPAAFTTELLEPRIFRLIFEALHYGCPPVSKKGRFKRKKKRCFSFNRVEYKRDVCLCQFKGNFHIHCGCALPDEFMHPEKN